MSTFPPLTNCRVVSYSPLDVIETSHYIEYPFLCKQPQELFEGQFDTNITFTQVRILSQQQFYRGSKPQPNRSISPKYIHLPELPSALVQRHHRRSESSLDLEKKFERKKQNENEQKKFLPNLGSKHIIPTTITIYDAK